MSAAERTNAAGATDPRSADTGSTDTVALAGVRAEVRAWLSEHWHPGGDPRGFLERAVDSGWACPTWSPDFFGRGLPEAAGRVVAEEFRRAGAPLAEIAASSIAVNVIRDYATSDHLRTDVVRRLLTGEYRTCLLYSEPGAGSDLAGLQTRADADGDEWVVNGQKVWTSGARQATHGLLVARTDWDVPKHRGITYFLLPMDQPGVEVRPIRQMTGGATFNEVFMTDARVPDSLRIGELNDGWRVLNTGLAVERTMMGRARPARGEVEEGDRASEVRMYAVDLVAVAKETGRTADPVIRQEIARIHALRRISDWNAARGRGESDMSTATVLKLAMSEILHGSAHVHAQLLGSEVMLLDTAQSEEANQTGMWAFMNSIGGGSDQIQRNIIAERVLGLPHDPSVDRDVPFRDVRKAEAVRRLSGDSG